MTVTRPLWQPDAARMAATRMERFRHFVNETHGANAGDWNALHAWSTTHRDSFWSAIWSFCDVIGEPGERIVIDADAMPGARWFPDARVSFAENMLRRRDDSPALLFRAEDRIRRTLSHRDLYNAVSQAAQALAAAGVGEGDRVAGYLPNMPEAIVAVLATASLGATWSSASPDFGVQGVVDRFGQIEPKVLFAADGYFYNGRTFDSLDKVRQIRDRLPSIRRVVIVPMVSDAPEIDSITDALTLDDFLASHAPGEITFRRLPFDHPLYILFSSGTTGVPKCIVHGQGGTLLQHLKEQQLHVDVGPGDRLFYFTTLGWMMWNWLVSGLASGATLCLYDGSPFHPDGNVLFDYAADERIGLFGTSAKYIDAVAKAGLRPAQTHDLGAIRTLMSTGSPLVPEGFDFVYENIGRDLCLSSISGGTDIISCFVLGNPALPVWRGEIQCSGLGMKMEVFDEDGNALPPGRKGELVCTAAFPSMPIGFWNDADGAKYRAAYFERFPGVWHHGDYCEITAHGGMIIYGRSDATLNPGGVRIGTAEIYRQAEKIDDVIESLVIGQQWKGDVRVVLFVRLREGLTLDDALIDRIRRTIRENTTPRHVPAKIVQVADIPRTKSGKIVELAVRNVVHGEAVKNREALANPDALELFRDIPSLAVD